MQIYYYSSVKYSIGIKSHIYQLLNRTHIFLKKEKQLETMTTITVVMMSQSNDDEERKTLHKRQRRHEDIAMRGSNNLQQTIELMKKQH